MVMFRCLTSLFLALSLFLFSDKLASLKSDDPSGAITSEGLAAAGLPQAMQNWILAVASAEGLTKKL